MWAALSVSAVTGSVLTACRSESGNGEVTGFLTVPGCLVAPAGAEACTGGETDDPAVCNSFDLDPGFFTLEREGDQAILRLQSGGGDFAQEDGLLLHLADVSLVRGRLGQPMAVGPEEPLRAALALFERCPGATESFELRGSITFEDFGVRKGDRVAGTLNELLVRDGRTGALLGRLHGNFDFTVRRGPPYRRFDGQ